MKPGFKTTEFWITLVVVLAGLLPSSGLLPENHWGVKVCGLVVSVAAAMGYTFARGGVKRSASNGAKLLLVGCLIALLAGCGTEGYVRAESIQPAVDLVTQMHDRLLMMELDPKTIKPEDRATYLRTSRLLRETVREASAQTD